MRCARPQSPRAVGARLSASNRRPPEAADVRFVDRPRAGEARNGAWTYPGRAEGPQRDCPKRRFWLAMACVAALMLAGCATDAKRPAGKHKPVATAAKSAPKSTATKKPAAKPVSTAKADAKPAATAAKGPATQQAKAGAPAASKPAAVSGTPQQRYAQALDLLKASQWQEAESALAAYVKEFPQYSGPHTNLGIVYARTNRKPQAAAEFAKAVSANPKNAVAHTWLGVLARETGDFKQAEMSYRRALAADLNYSAAHLNLAILYDQHMQKPQEALAEYRRYRELAGADDLRAAVWIAELESKLKPAGITP